MRTVIAIALVLTSTMVCAENQVIPVANEGWTIHLNAPKLEPAAGTVSSVFYGKADRLQVSLFLEDPRCPGGDSDESVYECFAASLKKNPVVKWETERANKRPKGGVTVMYMTQLEADGKIGKAFNINILFAKNGKWADLHMSIASPTHDDVNAIFAIADSVTVEESSPKKEEAPKQVADLSLDDAIKAKNIKEVERLLASGVDPKFASDEMEMPIVTAGFAGNVEIIRTLLEHGAPIDQTRSGTTCLSAASREGHIEAVKYLLSKNANVNIKDAYGMTAFTQTLGQPGSIEIAKLLVDAGADVNVPLHGLTPLMIAAGFGRTEWVDLLLKSGARVNESTANGTTALSLAKAGENSKIIEMLVAAGAKK